MKNILMLIATISMSAEAQKTPIDHDKMIVTLNSEYAITNNYYELIAAQYFLKIKDSRSIEVMIKSFLFIRFDEKDQIKIIEYMRHKIVKFQVNGFDTNYYINQKGLIFKMKKI